VAGPLVRSGYPGRVPWLGAEVAVPSADRSLSLAPVSDHPEPWCRTGLVVCELPAFIDPRLRLAFGRLQAPFVDTFIALAHSFDAVIVCSCPARSLVKQHGSLDGIGHLIDIVADVATDTVLDDFGHGTPAEGPDRCPRRQRPDQHQSERLGPVAREQRGGGAGVERRLVRLAQLADIVDTRGSEKWLDLIPE
jgi:hypothetical protein